MATTQKSSNFTECLKLGEDAEQNVVNKLLSNGCAVQAWVGLGVNSGPRLKFGNKTYILPDLLTSKIVIQEGKESRLTEYVDVKLKHKWVSWKNELTDIKGTLQTGIDKRCYLQYLAVSKAMGIPVALIFVQIKSPPIGYYTVLIGGQVNGQKTINPDRYAKMTMTNGDGAEMVFWYINSLRRIDEWGNPDNNLTEKILTL